MNQAKIDKLNELYITAHVHASLEWKIHVGGRDIKPQRVINVLTEVFNILELELPPKPTYTEIEKAKDNGYY